ncbi:MAG TPA: histidine phosphatase family protein [Anaerolineae bacterium]|nr:histidine phosphatase family protein [Anaerolineae bacterium]
MTVFYLIRHAHADWTPDEQRPLSSMGQEDAQRVADMLCNSPIARIYSSPFQRARQTVRPLANRLDLPVHIEPDLRERRLGDGPTVNDFFAAVKQTWREPSYAHPGGESNAAAKQRGVAVVQRLLEQYPGEHLILSTHGNLLTLVLQNFDPRIDYAFWKMLTMPDVYELQMEGGKASITRLWQSQG